MKDKLYIYPPNDAILSIFICTFVNLICHVYEISSGYFCATRFVKFLTK